MEEKTRTSLSFRADRYEMNLASVLQVGTVRPDREARTIAQADVARVERLIERIREFR